MLYKVCSASTFVSFLGSLSPPSVSVWLGEFGDYDPADHGTDYLDDFPLLENRVRDDCVVHSDSEQKTIFV